MLCVVEEKRRRRWSCLVPLETLCAQSEGPLSDSFYLYIYLFIFFLFSFRLFLVLFLSYLLYNQLSVFRKRFQWEFLLFFKKMNFRPLFFLFYFICACAFGRLVHERVGGRNWKAFWPSRLSHVASVGKREKKTVAPIQAKLIMTWVFSGLVVNIWKAPPPYPLQSAWHWYVNVEEEKKERWVRFYDVPFRKKKNKKK